MSLKMSQEKLGESVGLTFQQIQKYEKGTNRIGSSRLSEFARILGVPVGFFFEGAPDGVVSETAGFRDVGSEFMATREGQRIVEAFLKIDSPRVRLRVAQMIEAIADPEAELPHDR